VSRKILFPSLILIALFAVVIPAMVIGDHKTETGGGGGGETAAAPAPAAEQGGKAAAPQAPSGAEAQGKQNFTQSCGTCHTLADAGTSGKVGPVLDQVKPDKARVLAAIKNGGLGSGTMPANIVTGKDAQAVATYVSSVAGK
jgi:mono/diheme cytochrome c family protein